VCAVFEALASIEESLDLSPVVPHLREEFGMWDAQAVQSESFDVLIEFFQGHGIDRSALSAGLDGRSRSIRQEVATPECAKSSRDSDGLDGRSPIRGSNSLLMQSECLAVQFASLGAPAVNEPASLDAEDTSKALGVDGADASLAR
jgi:hypothetical protein